MNASALTDRTIVGARPIIEPHDQYREPRESAALVRSLSAFPVPDLSDAVGRLYTMSHSIRPLYPECPPLAGTACTVRAPCGDNKGVKVAVDLLRAGDVLVIDAQGFTDWCAGGFSMLRSAIADGRLAAVIVDGAYRDIAEFRKTGVPVYGRAISPATGPKLGPWQTNVPVSCGGVIVNPDDVVVGSLDGVVVIPHAHAERVREHLADRARRKQASGATGNLP